MNQLELENAAVTLINRRGKAVMEKTRQKLLNTKYDNGILDLALKHYAKVNLPLVLPLFPALTSLSYEAAKGNHFVKDETESFAVAMALIAFSADIHDDIIDQSTVKYAKKTIYGKYGSNIAILTGDALLVQGHSLLYQACESLSSIQRQAISISLPKANFELSFAEALETRLRKKSVIKPDEYFEIMRLRGVFAELQCRIGGIIGQADSEMLDFLIRFGRFVGMSGTIKDEFNDLLDVSELKHRLKFECPPLPMIYALQDEKVKSTITSFVEQADYSNAATKKIAKLVLDSEAVCCLKHKLNEQAAEELKQLSTLKGNRVEPDAFLLCNGLSFFET